MSGACRGTSRTPEFPTKKNEKVEGTLVFFFFHSVGYQKIEREETEQKEDKKKKNIRGVKDVIVQ